MHPNNFSPLNLISKLNGLRIKKERKTTKTDRTTNGIILYMRVESGRSPLLERYFYNIFKYQETVVSKHFKTLFPPVRCIFKNELLH